MTAIQQIPLKTIKGADATLADYAGKVVLAVNVASKCGLTPQYEGLEKLYADYREKGLVVAGFPANDFGAQEPGTITEIQQFCSTTYGVNFELFAKVGASAAPFDTLTQAEPAGPIAWNVEKFLVGRDGTVLGRFKSAVAPDAPELTAAIEAALSAGA